MCVCLCERESKIRDLMDQFNKADFGASLIAPDENTQISPRQICLVERKEKATPRV